jgi:hypothetical protein
VTIHTPGERFERLPPLIQATLLRIGRRVAEGFEGEITVAVVKRGVRFVRWTQTETGDVLKEELG